MVVKWKRRVDYLQAIQSSTGNGVPTLQACNIHGQPACLPSLSRFLSLEAMIEFGGERERLREALKWLLVSGRQK